MKSDIITNSNYKLLGHIDCCWNCGYIDTETFNNGECNCNLHSKNCYILGLCDNFLTKNSLNNNRRRQKVMTREESLELSKYELKAMQLEALINVTKEFLETCDDAIEREVLDQLVSFQDELKELKETYKLDF